MGLSSAKLLGKDHHIVLVGRTRSKLENALGELHALHIKAEIFPCDISDRSSVQRLVKYVESIGQTKAVINAAGLSPHMGRGETIFMVNAMGTIYMNEEFSKVMPENACILNISSMAAYMVPPEKIPKELYNLSISTPEAFREKMLDMINTLPDDMSPNIAYSLSKNFVIWYTERIACIYGKKGIRVVSISPGTFRTAMGELEGEEAASFAQNSALGRVGEPEEIANLMAFVASNQCGYLTGIDILCDGGSIAAMRERS